MSDDSDDDINSYVPSILNPRSMKLKDYKLLVSQKSILTAKSLSLKKNWKPSPREEALKYVEKFLSNSQIICNKSVTTECLNNNTNSIIEIPNSESIKFKFPNSQNELNNNKISQEEETKPEEIAKDLGENPKKKYYRTKDSVFDLLNELNDSSTLNDSLSSIIELVDVTSDICEDQSNDSEIFIKDDDIERKKKKVDKLNLNNDTNQIPSNENQILNKSIFFNEIGNDLILKQNNCVLQKSDFTYISNNSVNKKEINCDKECNKVTDDMSKPLRICKPNKCERGFSKSTSCSPTSSRLGPAVNNSGDKDANSTNRNELASIAPAARRKSGSVLSQNKDGSLSKIPYYKIIPGTHFAVDAFSYGDIKNVKHYFLTHFHSDHYCGLKQSFNKTLFCSKITADLCMTRLGVNSKYIQVLQLDETIRIEGTEVTALDANHCPGSIMLVFALPNKKNVLHTGDFRATPLMESNPIFWNKFIYTVYLDTTYCHPRFTFPTQEDSINMAVYILKDKKRALDSEGKKFSSVLIVCGTYTIGKEKFVLGLSREISCSIWAGTEKQRVLRACCDMTLGQEPKQCQLHVLPMRDICCHRLQEYLNSMGGAFSEVVAFKPSGWETNKTSNTQKDQVTIHGIPYSEHSNFTELIRFVKFLSPNEVVPTVPGGTAAIQKYLPCPVVLNENISQTRIPEYFSKKRRESVPVT